MTLRSHGDLIKSWISTDFQTFLKGRDMPETSLRGVVGHSVEFDRFYQMDRLGVAGFDSNNEIDIRCC